MEPDAIMELMKGYFKGKQPREVMDDFENQSPRALLKESLDVVEFVVTLEDQLGREIDTNELSDSLMNASFRELSIEVARQLAAEGA